MRAALIGTALAAGIAGAAAAQGLSGTIAPRGGVTDSDATGSNGTGWIDGALRFGLGSNLTALFDTAGGTYDNLTSLGGRGQLYWRAPGRGLVGVLAEAADRDGLTQWRTGVKGELYLGPVTLRAQGGYVFGDSKGGLAIDDSGYGVLSGGFYGLSGFGLNGGAMMQDGRGTGFGGLEAEIPGLPRFITATLDGAAGAYGYRQLLVGVRVYLGAGADAPLQQRHVGLTPGMPAFDLGATARPRSLGPTGTSTGGGQTCIPIRGRPCP